MSVGRVAQSHTVAEIRMAFRSLDSDFSVPSTLAAPEDVGWMDG